MRDNSAEPRVAFESLLTNDLTMTVLQISCAINELRLVQKIFQW